MIFRQKLSLLAVATILFSFTAEAQDQASKWHYDGIYKGGIATDLFTNSAGKLRAKSQLIVYPDGRLLVLTVESPAVRDAMNIRGSLRKNVFTGQWKKGFFGTPIVYQVTFHNHSAVVSATSRSKKPEKWYFVKHDR